MKSEPLVFSYDGFLSTGPDLLPTMTPKVTRHALEHNDLRREVRQAPGATRAARMTAEALLLSRSVNHAGEVLGTVLTCGVGIVAAIPGAAVGVAFAPLGALIGTFTRSPEHSWHRAALRGSALAVVAGAANSAVIPMFLCFASWRIVHYALAFVPSKALILAANSSGLTQLLHEFDEKRAIQQQENQKEGLAFMAQLESKMGAAKAWTA